MVGQTLRGSKQFCKVIQATLYFFRYGLRGFFFWGLYVKKATPHFILSAPFIWTINLSCDKINFMSLYKQRVRCHLEFAVQVWNPWTQHDINLVESVQRRAIRCVSGLYGTYEDKLKQVGLTTLYDRRLR